MREIKFKAWHKEEKKMCEVNLINFESGAFLLRLNPNEGQLLCNGQIFVPPITTGRFCHFDEFELMQFTGKTDKNGKDIYFDSEIVKFKLVVAHSNISADDEEVELTGVFRWDDEELRVEIEIYNNPQYLVLWYNPLTMKDFEVIGTVQENPELLGEKQ